MVAEAVLLLVGNIVFLVHHDQAGGFERREHRRAGAEHRQPVTRPRLPPGAVAFAIGQSRMQHAHPPEPRPHAGHQLRRKGDLRHQYQRLFAVGDATLGGFQVDLGFAAAGDAVQQE